MERVNDRIPGPTDRTGINRDIFFSEGSLFAIHHKLMPYRVRRVLLVASLYDYFMMEEDGRMSQLLNESYSRWNLGYVPEMIRVNNADEALELVGDGSFDLIIMMVSPDRSAAREKLLLLRSRTQGIPLVVMTHSSHDSAAFSFSSQTQPYDYLFVWQGDGGVIVSIIEFIEDSVNALSDTRLAGLCNLLVIEPSPEMFSIYLPVVLRELREHTSRLLHGNLTFTQRLIRQKARPRVHLARNFEEACQVYEKFKTRLLGIITEESIPREAGMDIKGGRFFVARVKADDPEIPVLILTDSNESKWNVEGPGIHYVNRNVSGHMAVIVDFMVKELGFGELVFRDDHGEIVERAANLSQFHYILKYLDPRILEKYVKNGSLTRWLRARTNFELADGIDLLRRDDAVTGDLNVRIGEMITEFRRNIYRGSVVRYSRSFYEDYSRFCQIDNGSIGGKARGLAFMDRILARYVEDDNYRGLRISIPRSLVIGTDVFDSFLSQNDLADYALNGDNDSHIANTFIRASLPPGVLGDLNEFIRSESQPLAVRSSSLLEDSLYQPFAGIYATKMIPNDQIGVSLRFVNLVNAVKYVYSSTYFERARTYIRQAGNKIGNEKMAVIIQRVVGRRHGDLFYPDFSGVARSFNYYPTGNALHSDGVVNLAVGLGKTIVEGGMSLSFIPAYPEAQPRYNTVDDMFRYSQREFYAVAMNQLSSHSFADENQYLARADISAAERDGVLDYIASTWSADNEMLYDGITIRGPRLITFAHILKNNVIPLAETISFLMKLCEDTMGMAVEMEFAVNLGDRRTMPAELFILQVRPMIAPAWNSETVIDETEIGDILCYSTSVMGNGGMNDIADIVYVARDTFDAAATETIAREVSEINGYLTGEKRPYILIGPGRWGTSDPWLGIPVSWENVSGARAFIETEYPLRFIEPSQGSHFFQNLTALGIGYFSAGGSGSLFVDEQWLSGLNPERRGRYVKHIHLDAPLGIFMDGRTGRGIIRKPGAR